MILGLVKMTVSPAQKSRTDEVSRGRRLPALAGGPEPHLAGEKDEKQGACPFDDDEGPVRLLKENEKTQNGDGQPHGFAHPQSDGERQDAPSAVSDDACHQCDSSWSR